MQHCLDTRNVDGGSLGEGTRYNNSICVNFSSDFLQISIRVLTLRLS
jgi:hypothetical protein